MFQKVFAAALLAFSLPLAMQAGPIRFNLTGFNFSGGGTAVGSFVYDPVLHQLISSSVVTTAGGVFSGGTYLFDGPSPTADSIVSLVTVSAGATTGTPAFFMSLSSNMSTDYTTPGLSISAFGIEGYCSTPSCTGPANPNRATAGAHIVSAGAVSATPEPATWLLGALSLLVAARSRKSHGVSRDDLRRLAALQLGRGNN